MDARPSLSAAFAVFGTLVTVKLPGGGALPEQPALVVTGVWLPESAITTPPGTEVGTVEPRYRMAFRRADVIGLMRGALVTAPAYGGGPVQEWTVDAIESEAAEEVRALLLPSRERYP